MRARALARMRPQQQPRREHYSAGCVDARAAPSASSRAGLGDAECRIPGSSWSAMASQRDSSQISAATGQGAATVRGPLAPPCPHLARPAARCSAAGGHPTPAVAPPPPVKPLVDRPQALFDLEATNAELKGDLRDLWIAGANEIDISASRKAILIKARGDTTALIHLRPKKLENTQRPGRRRRGANPAPLGPAPHHRCRSGRQRHGCRAPSVRIKQPGAARRHSPPQNILPLAAPVVAPPAGALPPAQGLPQDPAAPGSRA